MSPVVNVAGGAMPPLHVVVLLKLPDATAVYVRALAELLNMARQPAARAIFLISVKIFFIVLHFRAKQEKVVPQPDPDGKHYQLFYIFRISQTHTCLSVNLLPDEHPRIVINSQYFMRNIVGYFIAQTIEGQVSIASIPHFGV
jgi:hypothetical protein